MTNLVSAEFSPAYDANIRKPTSKGRSIYFLLSRAFGLAALVLSSLLFQLLYNDFSAWILVPAFLAFSLIGAAACRSGRFGINCSLLTYSFCALVAALAQNYASANFGNLMSQPDSNLFYQLVMDKSYNTIEELKPVVNAPLAVFIWKMIYSAISPINGLGPAAGVLFNAALLGIAGSLTIKSAKILFGENPKRLRQVSILFSSCGLVWLFGSLFLRDSFALLFNSLTFWALLKWLNKQSVENFALAAAVTTASGFSMGLIREGSESLFMAFFVLAMAVGFLKGRNQTIKIFVPPVLLIAVILGYSLIGDHLSTALSTAEQGEQSYTKWARLGSGADSLGVAFVTSQPLIIRAVAGSLYILIMPIPVWGYLQPGLIEYHLIKGYHAIYMVVIMPLLLGGAIKVLHMLLPGRPKNSNYIFVAIYFAATLVSVAATSLETRHLGQFATSMVLLAAISRSDSKGKSVNIRNLRIIWVAILLGIHLAWAGLKFLR